MSDWCTNKLFLFSKSECPILGAGVRTSNPILCANNTFWRQLSCGDHYVRCQGGNSGQCVLKGSWGVEGVTDDGTSVPCFDGSDMYRPIKQATEAEGPGRRLSQGDHDEDGSGGEYRDNIKGDTVMEDESTVENTTANNGEYGNNIKDVTKTSQK